MRRSPTSLRIGDFEKYPVWEYVMIETPKSDDTALRPVECLPVDSFMNRVIGLKVQLNNGDNRWAVLTNINLHDQVANDHFIALSLRHAGKWFHLAKYWNVDYDNRCAAKLAEALKMTVTDIFPIRYDISSYVKDAKINPIGNITEEPPFRLSDNDLFNYIVKSVKAESDALYGRPYTLITLKQT